MKRTIRIIITVMLFVCMLFSFALNAYARTVPERVTYMLKSKLLYNELADFIEVVDTGDTDKVFAEVLKMYPDLVKLAIDSNKEQSDNENNNNNVKLNETTASSAISDGNVLTLSVAIVISGVIVAAAIIAVNRKKTATVIPASGNKTDSREQP